MQISFCACVKNVRGGSKAGLKSKIDICVWQRMKYARFTHALFGTLQTNHDFEIFIRRLQG
jgi:hypothetical protein